MLRRAYGFSLLALLLVLLGCDSSPEKADAGNSQSAQPKLETARFALQKMIVPAHLWAADVQPIRMASSALKDNPGHDGKSGFWQATFASPGRQKEESFTWSGLAGPGDPPRGVDHSREDSFNPSNFSTQPFDLAFLKSDSDQAFTVAQQHGGKQLLEKNPDQPVIYVLDWNARTRQLLWHVIYGTAESDSRLTVIVNASTGDFVHRE